MFFFGKTMVKRNNTWFVLNDNSDWRLAKIPILMSNNGLSLNSSASLSVVSYDQTEFRQHKTYILLWMLRIISLSSLCFYLKQELSYELYAAFMTLSSISIYFEAKLTNRCSLYHHYRKICCWLKQIALTFHGKNTIYNPYRFTTYLVEKPLALCIPVPNSTSKTGSLQCYYTLAIISTMPFS